MEGAVPNFAIARAHFKCIDAFQNLLPETAVELDGQAIHDAFNRYRVWAGNVGAIHSGQQWKKSLDYRLREAAFYRVQVLKITQSRTHKSDSLHTGTKAA
jgi:hypothetical protein